jgi:hypothetical protein
VSSVLLSTAAGFLASILHSCRQYHYSIINSNYYMSYELKANSFRSNYHDNSYDPTLYMCRICHCGRHSAGIVALSLGVCCSTLQDHYAVSKAWHQTSGDGAQYPRRMKTSSAPSADDSVGRGGGGRNYRCPTILHMFLSFSVLLLLADLKINPLRPRPSHSATKSRSPNSV